MIEERHLEISHNEGVDKLKIVQKHVVKETPERQKAVMVRMHSIAGDFHKHTEDEDDVKIKKGEKIPKRTVDEEKITKVDRKSSISVGLNGQWALSEAVPQVSGSEDNSEKGEENKV